MVGASTISSGPANGTPGTDGTGGGGGGAGYYPLYGSGGNGGKGIVIIRYAGSQVAGGGTVDTSNPGYTTHIFTGDATFSVNSSVGQAFSIN